MLGKNEKLRWAAAAGICLVIFAAGYTDLFRNVFTIGDKGEGIWGLLTAPGLTAVPPSWVLRHLFLLGGVVALGRFLAPAGTLLVNASRHVRANLGDWFIVGVLAVTAGTGATLAAKLSLGGEGHVWDEREYLFQAQIFAAGRLTAPRPPTDERVTLDGSGRENFLVGLNEGVHGNRWFTIYMPVWPALLAAAAAIKAPWLANAAVGSATAFLVFGLGKRVFDADVALVGTFLYAVSPFVVFNNASYFSEPTFLLLLLTFLLLYDHHRQTARGFPAFCAGVVLALAFGAREYATFAAGLPVITIWLNDAFRGRTGRGGFLLFLIGALTGAAPLLLYNYLTSENPLYFPRFYAVKTHFGLERSFVAGDMLLFTTRRLWVLATDLCGWPLVSFLPALIPLFFRKIPARAKPLYAAALGTAVLFTFPHHKGINYGARYYYGALPALLLGGGYGLILLPDILTRKWNAPKGTATATVTITLLILTPLYYRAVEPVYGGYWGFADGVKPWVTPQLEDALRKYGVWQAVIFVAPAERCEGPPPNDILLKNNVIFARDRGARNAEFAALVAPRPYLLCDYRIFEATGEIKVLDIKTR